MKVLNKILNYKLFYSKLGDKFYKIPVVLGKTIKSKWVGDKTQQINIFAYWIILWVNGISIYKDNTRIQIIQKSYCYYICKWIIQRITKLIDNILEIIGTSCLTYMIIKYFGI